MGGRFFTPEEDAVILAGYASRPLQEIAAELGRNYGSVQQRAYLLIRQGRLDQRTRYTRRPWTPEQDAELRGRAGWDTLGYIAQQLHRTKDAIDVRCKRLGISVAPRWLTARSVVRLLDVDAKQVIWWIQEGWLAGHRSLVRCGSSRKWQTDGEALVAFLQQHPDRYDASRIPEPYLRKIAERAHAEIEWLTVEAAARRLGVDRETVRRHLRNGSLQGKRVRGGGGSHFRIRVTELERFTLGRRLTRCSVCGAEYRARGKGKYCGWPCRLAAGNEHRRQRNRAARERIAVGAA